MKFRKVLAGIAAAAMVTATVPLSVTVSAEGYSVGDRFYAKFDPSTGEVSYITDDVNYIAENSDAENNGYYTCKVLDDGSISVKTDCMGHAYVHGTLGHNYSITIPSEINGYTVTEISGSCWGGYISITIPDTVKKLNQGAFLNNYFLEEIIFGENSQLEVIDEYAFQNCRSLRSITIPATVKELGNGAFLNTIGKDLKATNSFDFTDVYSLTTVKFAEGSQLETIGEWAFQAQYALTDIVLPDSVRKIDTGAFNRCTSLAEINIPDGVTEIASTVFQLCESLEEIEIPDSVTSIGPWAFFSCALLTTVDIPDGVTDIGYHAFYSCTSLAEITIPASVTEIGEDAFTDCSDDLTICGCTNSYAEAYAKENEINFKSIGEVDPDFIEDTETEIQVTAPAGVLPENAELNVLLDEENSTEDSIAYDITITVDGQPAEINSTVTVTIPVPESLAGADNYYVYYQNGDNLTDMNATYADGYVTFTTTHFSTYIISTVALSNDDTTTTTADTTEPDTTTGSGAENTDKGNDDDQNPDTAVTLLLIPALAAAAGVIISKKRK